MTVPTNAFSGGKQKKEKKKTNEIEQGPPEARNYSADNMRNCLCCCWGESGSKQGS
jgi:hypothetical protein